MSSGDIIIEYRLSRSSNGKNTWTARYTGMADNIPSGIGDTDLEATQSLVRILANHIEHTRE